MSACSLQEGTQSITTMKWIKKQLPSQWLYYVEVMTLEEAMFVDATIGI